MQKRLLVHLLFGLFVVSFLAICAPPASSDVIETVAGNGQATFYGEGIPAVSASLQYPYGAVVDKDFQTYIADSYNNRIRKVDATGIISTVAGNGAQGFGGDGSSALQASLNTPLSVAVDTVGNIYIADTYNQRIRKVDTSGIISTIAGSGDYGYAGDGGPATSASFANPVGVAIDVSGNIFIADQANNRIRKIDTSGILTTVAGNGIYGYSGDNGPAVSAGLAYPYGVSVDNAGNLYIADFDNNRIRKVGTSGNITTVAGNGANGYYGDGGLATNAAIALPHLAVVDAAGTMYIADTLNAKIRKVDTGGIISTFVNGPGFAGDGGPVSAALIGNPAGVAVDKYGDVYVVDTNNSRIRWINLKPLANFTAGPDRGYRNINVSFSNTTRTATGTTYTWNFGDGNGSSAENPSYVYPNKGIYSVTLTAIGQGGLPEDTTSLSRSDYICAGYIFSNSPETATTGSFKRNYQVGSILYARVWALLSDVDYTRIRSTKLEVRGGGKRVNGELIHEGAGVFSGNLLLSGIPLGSATATFSIRDRSGKIYTATENITIY